MPFVDPSFFFTDAGIFWLAEAVKDSGVFYPKGLGYPHLSYRWPHEVHYKHGAAYYVPPTEFSCWPCVGPTDCEWIVPGTL